MALGQNPESGQSIVLIAFMMLALLAMLGLAIDGGGMYFLYRSAQNAADAAAVAATYARCTAGSGASIESAAHDAARINGFVHDGVSTWITVNHPPLDGSGAGDDAYVEVEITSTKESYFIQIVYRDPLRVTVQSIGYCEPAFDPASVPPIWAGSETCSDTVNWTGSGSYVEGGVFSNNEIKFGGGGQGNEIIGPTEAVTAVQTSSSGNAVFDPAPVTGVDVQNSPVGHYRLGDFAPGGSIASRVALYTHIDSSADDADFHDGRQEWSLNGSRRTLEGLYYVEGNVQLGGNLQYGVNGVTIVATGEISGSGGALMRYYIDGFLLISGAASDNCGSNVISISGNNSTWLGVLYAPNGGINLSGSSLTFYGAMIGDTINISGSNLRLIADPTIIPPRPPLVQVVE